MSFPSTLVSAHITVVVASHSDWMMGGAKVNFKGIKPPNQSESLVSNGGVHFWMNFLERLHTVCTTPSEPSWRKMEPVPASLGSTTGLNGMTVQLTAFITFFDFQFQTHDPVQRCLHLHTVHTSSYVMVEQFESSFDVPGLCLPSLYHIAHVSPFTNDSPHI